MRALSIVLLLVACPALADYETTLDLVEDGAGYSTLDLIAEEGSVEVTGSSTVDSVVAMLTVRIDGMSDEKAAAFVAERVVFEFDGREGTLNLRSGLRRSMFSWGRSVQLELKIQIPDHYNLSVDAGSGSLVVRDVLGSVTIDDGSGSMLVENVGPLSITDGSGSVRVAGVNGDVDIDDGSGGVQIESVSGSVRVDDGSGGISVRGVVGDLIIESSGSGSLRHSEIQGSVIREDD